MRAKNMTMLRFLGALCVCGMFLTQIVSPAFALDDKRCKKEIKETIKLLKKGEIITFSGKKMLKALKSYRDGINEEESDKLDRLMGPFDDNFKTMKKIYQNIQDIKEACEGSKEEP